MDRTLSGATTPGQSRPWNDGHEIQIHKISKAETSPSDV